MLKTIDLLKKEHREAATAVDNVIEQWKQKLIDRAASVIAPPSPADPDDPATWPAVESAKKLNCWQQSTQLEPRHRLAR